MENSQSLICTHDLEGNLLSVNEATVELSGYSRETLLQMNLKNVLAPNGEKQFAAYLKEINTQGSLVVISALGHTTIPCASKGWQAPLCAGLRAILPGKNRQRMR